MTTDDEPDAGPAPAATGNAPVDDEGHLDPEPPSALVAGSAGA